MQEIIPPSISIFHLLLFCLVAFYIGVQLKLYCKLELILFSALLHYFHHLMPTGKMSFQGDYVYHTMISNSGWKCTWIKSTSKHNVNNLDFSLPWRHKLQHNAELTYVTPIVYGLRTERHLKFAYLAPANGHVLCLAQYKTSITHHIYL